MSKYETEAVVMEIGKEINVESNCRLKPIAGGTAVEIDADKYMVGRETPPNSPPPTNSALWPLDSAGITKALFSLGSELEQLALAAWQAQRKVRLEIDGNRITKIILP